MTAMRKIGGPAARPADHPAHCVWELTLACNLRCRHCGSFAGPPREVELDAQQALDAADQLVEVGCERVTLMGGEPLLRRDWAALAQRLAQGGVVVEVVSNGLLIDAEKAKEIKDSGVNSVSLSIDGTAPVHDTLRAREGSFARTLEAVGHLRAAGLPVGAVSQINRLNLNNLKLLHPMLVGAGVQGWQVQLSEPIGRFKDEADWALTPADLPDVERVLLDIIDKNTLWTYAADNIGYMSRDEPRLRATHAGPNCFLGCRAGLNVLGLASDGAVRGCLSLPEEFNESNTRTRRLAELWADPTAFPYNRSPGGKALTGFCGQCPFGPVCRAGCTSLAWTTTGSLGDNPFCLFRLGKVAGQ